MAEQEAQDELVFTMVSGDPIRMPVAAGTGQQELADIGDGPWLAIGDDVRIRMDKIVSVKLNSDVRPQAGWSGV
jgi:hypothetical protein